MDSKHLLGDYGRVDPWLLRYPLHYVGGVLVGLRGGVLLMRGKEPGQLGRWIDNALDDLVGFTDVEGLRCFQCRVGCLDSLMPGGSH